MATDDRDAASETRRRSREAYLQFVFDSVNDAIFVHDARTGAIIDVNETARRMYGLERDEPPTIDVGMLSAGEAARCRAEAMAWLERAREGGPQLFEWLARRRDGQAFWVEVWVRHAVFDGHERFVVTVRDIDRRKRAEVALRESEGRLLAVVGHAPASITLKDRDGRYLVVNDEVARRFNTTAGAMIGRAIHDFVDADTAEAITRRDRAVLEGGAASQHEVENRDPDGTRRTLLVTRFPIFDAGGRVTGLGGIATDIGARKAAERAMFEAMTQAELASRAKSEFLANMSHELRTPLNSIIGFSEIMGNEMFGPLGHPRYKDYVGDIQGAGQLLLRIIGDILDLSRIEAGALVLDESDLDPREVLVATRRLLSERAQRKRIVLRCRTEPGLPRLRGDEVRVRQALLNLAANAIKFTGRGGRVTITAARSDDGGLSFQVSDTGMGMTADEIRIALQPFGQVASAQRRGHGGAGLGLPITRSLVELHGGTLEIASEPGRGTVATLRFPAARVVVG